MHIEFAQYKTNLEGTENVSVSCVIDGVISSVPMSENNRHYAEIMSQVEAGTLVIQEADNV